MKFIVYLISAAGFLQWYAALGDSDLSRHEILMGVSQQKLQDHLIKAFEGFRKMMPKGDQEMDYPVMDPYDIEDVSWDYVDKSTVNKYKLNFFNENGTAIKGLSNFHVSNLHADAKDMRAVFEITFHNVSTHFPYKLEGHLYKNFLPVWGKGTVGLSAKEQTIHCNINLGIEQSYIVVEEVKVARHKDDINVHAHGLMDLPHDFANLVLDDILDKVIEKHGQKALTDFVRELVEEAVGGMTVEEFFDYLDYFAKKGDEK